MRTKHTSIREIFKFYESLTSQSHLRNVPVFFDMWFISCPSSVYVTGLTTDLETTFFGAGKGLFGPGVCLHLNGMHWLIIFMIFLLVLNNTMNFNPCLIV